jgi:AcrR family transcriptional regulator
VADTGSARARLPADRSAAAGAVRGRPRVPGVEAAVRAAVMTRLAASGYARLTMDKVAERAGVSKDSLYRRWPNKVALVADALQRQAKAVPDVPDTGSLPGDMRSFLQALLRSRSAAERALAGVSNEIATNPELREAWHRGLGGMLTGCLREIVTRAADRGELPAGADVELLAQLPVALLQNWRLEHREQPGDAVVERIVGEFFTPRPPGRPEQRPGEVSW